MHDRMTQTRSTLAAGPSLLRALAPLLLLALVAACKGSGPTASPEDESIGRPVPLPIRVPDIAVSIAGGELRTPAAASIKLQGERLSRP
jgi:hypothetical protein